MEVITIDQSRNDERVIKLKHDVIHGEVDDDFIINSTGQNLTELVQCFTRNDGPGCIIILIQLDATDRNTVTIEGGDGEIISIHFEKFTSHLFVTVIGSDGEDRL